MTAPHAAGGRRDAPWWASGAADGAPADADAAADPLAAWQAVRTAAEEAAQRRDEPLPPGATRSVLEDGAEALATLLRTAATRGASRPATHDPSTCRACPWCTLLRAVGESRPEVVTHLGEAVRHLTLAARALVDAAEEPGGWQRVPLDDDGGP